MQRRHFLQTGSALGAMGLMSGCATPGGASMGKVVVIGGGYGGATAAKYLRLFSEGAVDVTLVEPNAAFVSCPLSNLVLGGSRSMVAITLSYDRLAQRHGVRIVRDTATAIDPERQQVRLAAGAEFVVMVCGDIMTMPGLPKQPASERIGVDQAGHISGLS